jgi:STE24 endopeptidase
MTAFTFSTLFAAALVLSVLAKLWLASRQIRHVAAHRAQVPADFASRISLAAHQKAADYTVAKARFGVLELAWGALVLLGWTLLGGLDWLNLTLLAALDGGMLQQLALLGAFMLIGGLIDLPFSLYQTFVLEERYGFNKMTLKLWLVDAIKGAVVGALIGLPLAAAVLWLMGAAGAAWWLWAWALLVGFQLLMLIIYPTLIAPIFNKFEPLKDESLASRVRALMQRSGFKAKGFFVMDGSRRSAHANAYFTGFGSSKRVVFFDTLLAKLSTSQVEAVLAHELGHFKHKHVVKRMVIMFGTSLLGFALLGYLTRQVWFYQGLGVTPSLDAPNNALALLLFMLAVPVFSFFLTPLMAQLSRRDEFQADAYAVQQTNAQDLGQALLKLYEDNASTLTPDPLFVKFYYSHPSASERLARMGFASGAGLGSVGAGATA